MSKKTPIKSWIEDYQKDFLRYKKYCKDNNWMYMDNTPDSFDTQFDMIKILIGRLKKFYDKFESSHINVDNRYKYVQEFLDTVREPIDEFIERCEQYKDTVDWSNKDLFPEDKPDKLNKEIKFQNDVMDAIIKVKDAMIAVNMDEQVLSLELPIHSDKPIPFLMKDIVEQRFPQIKTYIENSKSDEEKVNISTSLSAYDISTSTEMFLNLKNPPKYDPDKHYFEQTDDVLQFYEAEFDKIKNGVTIGGVFIHPWLYWHLNYFKTDLPMSVFKGTDFYDPSEKVKIWQPPLRDNELLLADCLLQGESENKGVMCFGSRRIGKTIMEASYLMWIATKTKNAECILIGGDEGDLQKLSKSIEIGFSHINPAFSLTRNTNNWDSHVQFGLKDKSSKRIPYSDIFIRNVNGGKGKGSEKVAGATPDGWVVDEVGKLQIKTIYQAAIPSFQTPTGWGTIPLLLGTGGNAILSQEAQEMLLDPVGNEIITMDWNRLERDIKDKDLVSWKRKDFGVFLPAHMSFKTGIVKDVTNLSAFLNVDDDSLKQIEIKVTNWERATRVIKEDRAKKSKDLLNLAKEKMYYPLDPLDCFLNRVENPFPAVEAQAHYDELYSKGDYGKAVDIYNKEGSSKLYYSFSSKQIADFPYKGGNVDAPVIILEDPPENNDINYSYVAGLDHYKHAKADTDSVGVMAIFKRMVGIGDEFSDSLVAIYASRPDTMKKFNRTAELLMKGYGARCLQENADISFQEYLQGKNEAGTWLVEGEPLARSYNPNARQNNRFGLNASAKNKNYILSLVIAYCREELVVGVNDDGSKIIKLGVTRIKDLGLLKEILGFTYDANTDRIIAFGHALAYAAYLDSQHILPTQPQRQEKTNYYKKQAAKQKIKSKSPYSSRRSNPYGTRR